MTERVVQLGEWARWPGGIHTAVIADDGRTQRAAQVAPSLTGAGWCASVWWKRGRASGLRSLRGTWADLETAKRAAADACAAWTNETTGRKDVE